MVSRWEMRCWECREYGLCINEAGFQPGIDFGEGRFMCAVTHTTQIDYI